MMLELVADADHLRVSGALVVRGVGGRSRVSFQAQQQALGALNGILGGTGGPASIRL